MKFTNKKTVPWLHLVFWIGLYIAWITVFQKHAFSFSRTMTVQFCYLLFIAGAYYFNASFSIPRSLFRKKYILFIILFSASLIAAASLRVPLALYLNRNYFLVGLRQPNALDIFRDSLLNIFIWVSLLVAAKLALDRMRLKDHLDLVEKEKIKNELDFLKAQFNPHFLFNSINSIYGNIEKSNPRAREMLLSFSEMLRYQLYECNTGMIAIEKEVSYIRNYIALQQSRSGGNQTVDLHIAEDLNGTRVAPLLMIGFIENSFKYLSRFEDRPNLVRICLYKKENQLVFTIFNTMEPFSKPPAFEHSGIGLINTMRRLDLLYPGRHRLEIKPGVNCYEVNLNLEL